MSNCPKRFELVRYKAGELTGQALKDLKKHLDQCAECAQRLKQMEKNMAIFEPMRAKNLESIKAAMAADNQIKTSDQTSWVPKIALALAATIALVFAFIVVDIAPSNNHQTNTGVSFKGALAVEVVAKRDDNQFKVTEGDSLSEGDELRFVLTTDAAGYVMVFSIDSGDRFFTYYPDADLDDDPSPHAINSSGRHELPGGVILDDSEGEERFYVVFSSEKFKCDKILQCFKKLDQCKLGSSFSTYFLKIKKQPR